MQTPGPSSTAHSAGGSTECQGRECSVARRLLTAANLLNRTADRIAAPAGLTSARWLMLCRIAQFDSPPSVSDLSHDTLLTAQNVSRMLAAMEADGLIVRDRTEATGRTNSVQLSDAGRAALEQTLQLAERIEPTFLAGFSQAERERLESDLQRMIDNLCLSHGADS